MMPLLGLLLAVSSPEARAVEFLSKEVPAWPAENQCFSCHNNGDAARALFAATATHAVPDESMAATLRWLTSPNAWGEQKGEEAFSDVVLTRIQFASALLDAIEAGLVLDRVPLREAAALVASDQGDDGSWRLDASGSIGSPATYGTFLATATAVRVLGKTDSEQYARELEAARTFLRAAEVKTVLAAAAVLYALPPSDDAEARAPRDACLDLIRAGQAPSGGWGPYVTSAPEPFDTALVLLALTRDGSEPELVASGRAYLLETQLDDGSWAETTRPAGQISYAQYISTTGWALLALLATTPMEP